MKLRYISSMFLWVGLLITILIKPAFNQSYVSQAQSNGFTLKKVVSDTAIATGQNFSYTIYFSIPVGATAVTITDVLPTTLTFQSINVTSACGSPVVTSPPVNSMGGTVTLAWASVPGGCSGSFVITVNFPNGTTCNGTTARNRVCMVGNIGPLKADFCTGFVNTRAIAVDPWAIGKWVIGAGAQPGACGYVTADSIVTYQICVWKAVGTTGQLNLENAVVRDTLPAGATLVPASSSCGMTQTGNVITWNIGSLSALSMYNTQCCTFKVLYPTLLFPTGTQIKNRATLSGTLGSLNNPCGQALHPSNQTCVELKSVIKASFSKYVYTNGQPGCSGKYQIWVCNNGSAPISSMTITDTIPAPPLTGISIGAVSSGLNATLSGNIVTVTLTSTLLPTQCRYFEVNFTIPLTAIAGTLITNCAWLSIPGIPPTQACASFTVVAPAPKPCLWKEVCSKQTSYQAGDIFRYRLRVQNIGGLPITGATITDVLNTNLQYIGNPSYYTSTVWNAPCQSTSNWAGVAFSQSGNSLTFTLPTIAATCQNIFYNACGMYGTAGVPFYFIEFDVKVTDTTALGNIPNVFTISGGNLTSPTSSNIDYVNVIGTSGFLLDKSVAKDTTNWGSSTTTTPSSNVNYRLRLTVSTGSVGLRHITFADLLPRDNNTTDQLILGPCLNRSSLFNVSYVSPILTLPTATGYNNNASAISFAAVNNFAPTGSPGNMFVGGCGAAGTWLSGIASGNKNLGYYFGATPVGAGNSATSIFSVAIPSSAQPPDSACNTFAANAAVRHLINSTIISDQQIGQLESQPACVTVQKDSSSGCFTLQPKSITSTGVDASGLCTYSIVVTATNPGSPISGWFESSQGTVTPATLTIPTGSSTQTLTFTDTPPTDIFICIRYGIFVNGQKKLCDSICFDITPCGQSNLCDSLSIKLKSIISTGTDAAANCTYSIDFSVMNSSTAPLASWFDSYQGTVAPATLTIPTGSSTQTITFVDTPPTDIFICIRYGIFANGQKKLCDSVCFDLPPCSSKSCDSLIKRSLDTTCCEYDVTIANGVGSPITSISYYLIGGTVNSITTLPCTPVVPATVGSTSGILTYSPSCSGNINFSIQATPTTPSNVVMVQLVIHHGNKDSCIIRFEYVCDPSPLIKCDDVKVKPFLFTGLNLSGRTFTVFNLKVPASPITYIDIVPVPTPCFLQGGGLYVDFISTSWSVPYLRIPISGFISANTQVKFNLGVDYTCNWTGNINLVIHHADGDSCKYSYGPWKALPPNPGGGVIIADRITKRVYANKLRLQNTGSTKAVKWISFNVDDKGRANPDVIVAGSGAYWGGTILEPTYAKLDGNMQGMNEILFSFEEVIRPGATSDYFNLVVARDSAIGNPPLVRWTTYDEDGNAIATDTVRITSTVLSIRGEGKNALPNEFELLQFFPNPSTNITTINYVLGTSMDIRLELFNQQGEYIDTIEEDFKPQGMQTVRYNTTNLPVGNYYLRLSSNNNQIIKPMMIMR